MRVLITGSAGHLGEALVRRATAAGHQTVGLDIKPSPFTDHVGSITDRLTVRHATAEVDAILHGASLHKPHAATHSKQDFIDTNITGTLNLLEEAASAGINRFVYSSTTSAFGDGLTPAAGAPAAWIDEDAVGRPKNIYGATKTAAEDLCALFARNHRVNCIILRLSRFFPEADDSKEIRRRFTDANAKANEFLYRRVDIDDAVHAHLQALERVGAIGFGRFIISAPSPFKRSDLALLRQNPIAVIEGYFPDFAAIYERAGYQMFPSIDRVYVSDRAIAGLRWRPRYDFRHVLSQIDRGEPIGSDLGREVGVKGYHSQIFDDGPYPVDG